MKRSSRKTRLLNAALFGMTLSIGSVSQTGYAHDCVGITPDHDPDTCAGDWPPDADHMCTRQVLAAGSVLYVCMEE